MANRNLNQAITPLDILKMQPQALWLVSVPELGDLTRNLQKHGLAESVKMSNFHIPKDQFRVGTLDQLVTLNDDIARVESNIDQLSKKLCSYLFSTMCGQNLDTSFGLSTHNAAESDAQTKAENISRLMDNCMLNQNRHHLADYVRQFKWDVSKYPIKGKLLKDVLTDLSENIYKTETTFKKRSTDYNNINRDLMAILKKQTGSLLTRDLTSVIDKKRHLVQNSEYLETLIVAVPNNNTKDWLNNYERLADYVVPRSSSEIVSDSDYTLFTVTLFSRCVDEFKTNCQKKKFTIREISKKDPNNNETAESPEVLLKKLKKDRSRQYPILIKWLQANYRDSVSIMMHLKVLKCFVESVLRYGLPVKFESILIQPPARASNKLNLVLDETYKNIDRRNSSQTAGMGDTSNLEGVSIAVTSELNADYRPYVYNLINCDFVHNAVGFNPNY